MERKLTQRNKILQILSDYQVHCLAQEMYCKDDRTRISELRKLGYLFDETLGNCQNFAHRHGSGLKLRKLINNPLYSDIPVHPLERPLYEVYKQTAKVCCFSFTKFKVHASDCPLRAKEKTTNALF